jgi:hypothetical protein
MMASIARLAVFLRQGGLRRQSYRVLESTSSGQEGRFKACDKYRGDWCEALIAIRDRIGIELSNADELKKVSKSGAKREVEGA